MRQLQHTLPPPRQIILPVDRYRSVCKLQHTLPRPGKSSCYATPARLDGAAAIQGSRNRAGCRRDGTQHTPIHLNKPHDNTVL